MTIEILKEPRYISFADGVVRPAFNEGDWVDPRLQLRDRIVSYGRDAQLLDENYNVLASMTWRDATRH